MAQTTFPLAAALVLLPVHFSMAKESPPRPPQAARRLHVHTEHGARRVDPYFWLKERENPEVIEYLKAENTYVDRTLQHTAGLQKKLFEEFKARIKKDDSTPPAKKGEYWYLTRFAKGKEHPIFARRKGSLEGPEEVLLDVNKLAKGHDFYQVRAIAVSPDHNLYAYAFDTTGRRICTIMIKDLRTGKLLPDKIEPAVANMAWANDNETLFYTRQDTQTLRSDRIFKHRLGKKEDSLVYEEKDETFSVHIERSASGDYLVLNTNATVTSEARILEAGDPDGKFRLFAKRRRGHEYSIAHGGDRWYIVSNRDGATNFAMLTSPPTQTAEEHWTIDIPHDKDVLLEWVRPFKDFLVLAERKDGLNQIRVRRREDNTIHALTFNDPAYAAVLGRNLEFDTAWLRFDYESMTTPNSTYDYHMSTRQQILRKRQEVLGGFDPKFYVSERVWAKAGDGLRVPISLVRRKDNKPSAATPLILYGYGSYGLSIDPWFSSSRLSWLDRGGIYAIAHIRGGQELGRRWYEDGRQLKKRNTFTDFIACGEHLVQIGYTSPRRLYAEGGSAGGLLMGAVMNLAPDLFHGILAGVPFVDVVTTMLDSSIPLTTSEYDEWGNPNEKSFFDYMLSYSPYDNVGIHDYPNVLVTTGLSDSQVQYWEPAKWVARLRARKTGDSKVLLKTDMTVGHGGKPGRFESLKQTALEYAFLLDLEGIKR